MNQSKKNEPDHFLEYIFNDNEDTADELREELKVLGINMQKIDMGVAEIVTLAQKAYKTKRLDDARSKRLSFQERVKIRMGELADQFSGVAGLAQAIKSGQLSSQIQGLHVHFRNRDINELSDEDLISLLEEGISLNIMDDEDKE